MVVDRNAHLKVIYGEEKFNRINKSKVLVVGAGGIGCEVSANVFMVTSIDVDIIFLASIRFLRILH